MPGPRSITGLFFSGDGDNAQGSVATQFGPERSDRTDVYGWLEINTTTSVSLSTSDLGP